MNENIRLGTIAGVRVGLNWSVLVIFLLITAGLATGRFPEQYPDANDASYAVAGIAAGLVFFASLLAHEMAHALVARRNGVEVEGITLWLFGGVARLMGEAETPVAAIRISAVGPAVSVALAALFGAVALGLDAATGDGLVVGVFVWLSIINIVLAVFNLMPAAPLDGGRILRGVLWWRHGDPVRASLTASRAGRTLGWVLVAVGIVDFVGGTGIGGLWLALIGWFLTSAAAAEEQQTRVRHDLAGVTVDDVMTPDPTTVPGDITVETLLDRHVLAARFSSFPVVGADGELVGLVTLNRIKALPPDGRRHARVADIACPLAEVPLARPGEPLVDLLPRMAGCSDGRALVLDRDRLVGIISPSDVSRRLQVAALGGSRPGDHASGERDAGPTPR